MSKFFTTLFLTIATLLSGLVLATSSVNVSAALNDPLRCSFPGRYIERSLADAPCVSCPVDFYCPTQIRNGSDVKPSQFSPEKPGKNGQANSEVIPCPSGTTTLGFTYHPYKLSLLTKDEDGFKVGTLATDMSMCRTPDFKCPASTPRLVNLDGKSSCYLACPSAQVEVIKDGMQSCILECRAAETSVNGKCYEACKDGSTLTIINGVVNCNDKCLASSIRGQIVGPKGNCECPVGTQIIIDSGSYSTGRCGVVIISSSSSSVTPPPVSSSSSAIPPPVSSSSISSVTPRPVSSSSSVTPPPIACPIPSQIRSYGTCVCPNPSYLIVASNGTKSCGTCPADNFLTQAGVEANSEAIFKCNAPVITPEPVKPTNNGGGGSDFWTYAGIAVGAYALIDGFTCGGLFTFVSCDSPKAAVAAPLKPTYNEINGPIQDCSFGRCVECPSDRRAQSTNNGTVCVCAYGTQDYNGECGVDIFVPTPKPSRPKAPAARDGEPGTGIAPDGSSCVLLNNPNCKDGDVVGYNFYDLSDNDYLAFDNSGYDNTFAYTPTNYDTAYNYNSNNDYVAFDNSGYDNYNV